MFFFFSPQCVFIDGILVGIFSVTLNPMKVEKAPHSSGIPVSLGWKMSLKSLTMLFLLHSVTFYSIFT